MSDRSETAHYSVRRDAHGFATAIEDRGYTVLILATGAQRNEEEVNGLVAKLNRRVTDAESESGRW